MAAPPGCIFVSYGYAIYFAGILVCKNYLSLNIIFIAECSFQDGGNARPGSCWLGALSSRRAYAICTQRYVWLLGKRRELCSTLRAFSGMYVSLTPDSVLPVWWREWSIGYRVTHQWAKVESAVEAIRGGVPVGPKAPFLVLVRPFRCRGVADCR